MQWTSEVSIAEKEAQIPATTVPNRVQNPLMGVIP
jgi:hypothetical protein